MSIQNAQSIKASWPLTHSLKWCIVALVAPCLWLTGGDEAQAFDYVIQPGDTLVSLSKRFYGEARHWPRIDKANSTSFQIGNTLFIPEDGDPDNPAATLVAFSGEVALTPPAGVPVRITDGTERALLWQRTLETREGGNALLRLASGGFLHMSPGTSITMIGSRGNDAVRLRMDKGELHFEGKSEENRLEIVTPDGLATLVGHNVKMFVTKESCRIDTYNGSAFFGKLELGVHSSVTLPLGTSGNTPEIIALTKLVTFTGQTKKNSPVVVAWDGEPGTLSWDPVENADGYEIEVKQLFPTEKLISKRTLSGDVHQISVPARRSGLFMAQIRGINKGRPGLWSTSRFAVVALKSRTPRSHGGEARYTGLVELEADSGPFNQIRYGLNGPPSMSFEDTILISGAGHHTVQIGLEMFLPEGGVAQFGGQHPVEIDPISKVAVYYTPDVISPGDTTAEISVTVLLADDAGNPVTHDAPWVSVGHSSCRALPTSNPGSYACALTAQMPMEYETLPLIVTGRGGSFSKTIEDALTRRGDSVVEVVADSSHH